jgi:hypothetical protein
VGHGIEAVRAERPKLFPVRDNLVLNLLGLLPSRATAGYGVNWQVFRRLVVDQEITDGIATAIQNARTLPGDIRVEEFPLRQLDVLPWMHAKDTGFWSRTIRRRPTA